MTGEKREAKLRSKSQKNHDESPARNVGQGELEL